jgi:predicted amidohydrolase YtcJ
VALVRTLLRNASVNGRPADVVLDGRTVHSVQPASMSGYPSVDHLVDAAGGALLPGLHDHHLHLLAMAAAENSVECSPDAISGLPQLRTVLTHGRPGEWVRGVGYHESIAGPLDRDRLDELTRDRPVRIQHRSGALWMLNSAAIECLDGPAPSTSDAERFADGRLSGRFWRMDDFLRRALPSSVPGLRDVGGQLAAFGITGVTDATPDLEPVAEAAICDAIDAGDLNARVTLLGVPTPLRAGGNRLVTAGPAKILLADHNLPSFTDLRDRILEHHEQQRSVAVHCVTRDSLLLTLAVLGEVGVVPGDRIEHASIVPPEVRPVLASLALNVVTQPDFLRVRGDFYARDVSPADLNFLYPHRSLLDADVQVAASSDAPFGELDPWQVMASAAQRRTVGGLVLGVDERVSTTTALAGYLSGPRSPGGATQQVAVGTPADLVLLHAPLHVVLREPRADFVRATWFEGTNVYS